MRRLQAVSRRRNGPRYAVSGEMLVKTALIVLTTVVVITACGRGREQPAPAASEPPAPPAPAASAPATAALPPATSAQTTQVFEQYSLDRQAWTNRFVEAVAGQGFGAPPVTRTLKNVPPAGRAALVAALGAAAKAYVATAGFQTKYRRLYEQSLPEPPAPARTAKQIGDEARKEAQQQMDQLEGMLKGAEGDARDRLLEPVENLKEYIAQIDASAAQQAEQDLARYRQEKAAYDAARQHPQSGDTPADATAGLKRTIQAFLDGTAGVDYGAATTPLFGQKVFVRPDYESKPDEWKMCYRAGREACEAARAFASEWLKGLN